MGSDDAPPASGMGIGRSGVPSRKCKGRTCIRHPKDHDDPDMRYQPILDANGMRQYKPCAAWAANGTEYCTAHGGTTPAAVNAAKRLVALGTPNAAEVLLDILNSPNATDADKIKAAVQILDRGGVRPGVDVSVEIPGWQKVLSDMFGSSTQDEPEEATEPEPEAPPPPRKRATKKAAPPPEPMPDNVRKLVPRKATKATPPQHKW